MLARIRALSTDDAAPAAGLSGAWSYLRLASEHAVASDVDDEFHQLFIGLGRGELVPFGSWYLTGFLMERPLGRLRDDLSALGFERQEGVREPEDHIAALFEVMALLIRDPRVTLGSEQKFFSDHIEPWAGRFFADLEAAGEARYYRAVGRLGSAFFGVEKESLAMLV
jgi:TorA maturation chaperone TorD